MESQATTTANMNNLSKDVKIIADSMPKVVIIEERLNALSQTVKANKLDVEKKHTKLEKAFVWVFMMMASGIFSFIYTKLTSI